MLTRTVEDNQQKPRLLARADGGFVAVWEDGSKSQDDPNYLAVRARAVRADGTLSDDEILVTVTTRGHQQQSVVTGTDSPLVVWTDEPGQGIDIAQNTIRSRLLRLVPAASPEPSSSAPTTAPSNASPPATTVTPTQDPSLEQRARDHHRVVWQP